MSSVQAKSMNAIEAVNKYFNIFILFSIK